MDKSSESSNSSNLTEEERERTKRQKLIEGWNQHLLKQSTVFIAGVGALGCEIAKDLALMGIGKLVLCDMDKVETSNLSRQMLFYRGDEGNYKAEVAAERLKLMNPYLKIDTYTIRLQEIPMKTYQECDVVIAALDSVQARMDLNKFCLKLGIPLIEGGTIGMEGHVQVIIPEETITKDNSAFPIGNKQKTINYIAEELEYNLKTEEYPNYFQAKHKIKQLETQIEQLEQKIQTIKESEIHPIQNQLRIQAQQQVEAEPTKYLHHTACYRCLVPVPPLNQDQVAACTLKGIPRTRDHCAIKGEVTFINTHNRSPDYKDKQDMLEIMQYAQKELQELRNRVLQESIPPDMKDKISPKEIATIEKNIYDTFGGDFALEDMENILGNKIPAIQSVSSIISSVQSQEALKVIYKMRGGDIGPIMDPPYLNYNGKYGIFEQLPVIRRPDCVACGSRQGMDILTVAIPYTATIDNLFDAIIEIQPQISRDGWIITNPLNKQFIYNPMFEKGKTGNRLVNSFGIKHLDEVVLTAFGKAKKEGDVKQYNVIIHML